MKKIYFLSILLMLSCIIYAQAPVHLTDQTFKTKVFNYEKDKEWKYQGNLPAIVDFYADWCGPCKRVAPILEQLSKEYKGKIIVYKVNTDNNPNVSSFFGITSIPSFLFIPASGKPQFTTGAISKDSFKEYIANVLKVK
jgi:thioredoxin 1